MIILLEVQDDKDESKGEEKTKEADESSSRDRDTDEKEKAAETENNKEEKKDTNKTDKGELRDDNQIPVSPLARKVAREHDVDLTEIKGSGPGNRISKADVEDFVSSKDKDSENKQTTPDPTNTTKESLNNIGRITAQTMQEAWQTIPHVTQFDEADITKLEKFRQENQEKI